MKRLVLTLVALVGAASSQALAAPLDLGRVAADAQWLAHVDFDAIGETLMVQKMKKSPNYAGKMAMVQAMIGMNPDKDLRGVTMYGKRVGKEEGVMILDARMDQKRVMEMIDRAAKPEKSELAGRPVMTMEHKPRHRKEPMRLAVAFLENDLVVAASSIDELRDAVAVIDGKADSLSADSKLAGTVPPGTTMLMRVEGISEAMSEGDCCKLAKQTKSFRFVTGEYEGQSFYRSRTEMTNAKVAEQLEQVIEGAKALGQLHVGDNEVGQRLVNDLRVKAEDGTLTVLWKGSAEEVIAIVDAHRKIFAEKKAKYRAMKKGEGKKAAEKKAEAPKKASEEDF